MNPRPASPRRRRLLPIAAAAVIGVGAAAGAYALANHGGSSTSTPSTVVVPAQPASSTSTTDSLSQPYQQDAPAVVYITVQPTSGGGSQGFPSGLLQRKQQSQAEGAGF